MKLKDLIKKLQGKPDHEREVEFIVYEKGKGPIVCAELSGPSTNDLMALLAKNGKKKAEVE